MFLVIKPTKSVLYQRTCTAHEKSRSVTKNTPCFLRPSKQGYFITVKGCGLHHNRKKDRRVMIARTVLSVRPVILNPACRSTR
ncbi:hypothetical protein J2Z65_002268 [Paenibacillus aceris]|uniref:Uncharacterized protein n=1 Tax=Paenibacillus aceris TaxID=869555 RepID=A0ABS4HWM8_9BACL|nr:hypothetical protein [Paenibacillus aceris]